jgi:hypothetical protein
LFAVREGSQASVVDAPTLKQLFEIGNLLAVEWENLDHPFPACIREQAANLTKVLGSDSHSFQGARTPGSRFTWVKMASPTIKGLRLALLDGNGGAVERWGGDEAHGRARLGPPSVPPALVLREVRLSDARCMGQGTTAATLRLNPWFNAIIGGRGSGKSTWVHALRLVLQRTGELERRVDSGKWAAAFSLAPTPMADLMAVADTGEVMPPKSTWFEPKLADGLVSLMLRD